MKSVPVEKWSDEKTYSEYFFDECAFTKRLSPEQCQYAIDYFTKFISPLKEKAIQAARIEVKVDRDDSWRAFLQKLAWKKEEIDDATEWVDRTPLRLRSNHSLESIINKHQ